MAELQKITPEILRQHKKTGRKFACLTAYDAPSAHLAESSGIELVLVGDSVANAVLGLPNTRQVTLEEMLHHTRAVRRGAPKTFLVTDLPYESSRGTPEEVARNARRLIEEGGADAVKIEGPVFDAIRRTFSSGVPVMAHLGLTPQTAEKLGVQARSRDEASKLLEDAREVERSGAFALVLECIPRQLAGKITELLKIPTIGIGAGPDTDGQILVWHDLLGFGPSRKFKFVRRYLDLDELILGAVNRYRDDVGAGRFPSDEESFHLTPGEADLS